MKQLIFTFMLHLRTMLHLYLRAYLWTCLCLWVSCIFIRPYYLVRGFLRYMPYKTIIEYLYSILTILPSLCNAESSLCDDRLLEPYRLGIYCSITCNRATGCPFTCNRAVVCLLTYNQAVVCPLMCNRVVAHRYVSRPVLRLVSQCCGVFVMFHDIVMFCYSVVWGVIWRYGLAP